MRELHVNGPTPAAFAIAIALREKQLAYSLVEVDWRDTPAAAAAFRDSLELSGNLEGEFPILVDDGTAIADSFFILEYLDDCYPDLPLKPTDAYGEWQVQSWSRFLGERAAPAVATLGVNQYFSPVEVSPALKRQFADAETMSHERREAWLCALDGKPDDALIEESRRKVELLLDRVENTLSGSTGDWLLGETFSITDIAAFALVHSLHARIVTGFPLDGRSLTKRWLAAVGGRPAASTVLAEWEMAFLPGPEHARWG